jgi:fluoride exporter
MSVLNILLVMLGGFIGAVLRFLTGEWVHSNQEFPIGTLTVNLLGCFVLGALFSYYKEKYPRTYLFLGTGLVGSFTTFSTFSVETLNLIKNDQYVLTFTYILISVVGGLGVTLLGYKLALHKGATQ